MKVGVYVGSYGIEKDWRKRDEIQQREFNAGFIASSWDTIQIGAGKLTYPLSLDQDVARATSSAMEETYFHLITWFQHTPGYLKSLSSDQVRMEAGNYVKDYVKHYSSRGQTRVLNIVNEAYYTYLGGDVLLEKLGKDYVTFLFEEGAKAAKPGDTLVYSDYDILPRTSSSQKNPRDTLIREILTKLKNSSVIRNSDTTIGLGMQASLIAGNDLTPEEIASIIDSYGVPVYVTEADVLLSKNDQPDRLQTQAENYMALLSGILLSKNCRSIYIFGTDDKASWYERQPDLAEYSPSADPLLFDDNFDKKAAYYGLLKTMLMNLDKR